MSDKSQWWVVIVYMDDRIEAESCASYEEAHRQVVYHQSQHGVDIVHLCVSTGYWK